MARPDGRASARKSFVLLVVGMVVFFLCSVSSAEVPDSINYQGKLTTAAGGCVNDTVQMTFSIYPDTLPGTTADWTETQMQVVVKDGIFDVLLGSVNSLPASVFDGNAKYLGVQVESDPEMRPLKPMVSTSYAFRSHRSQEADTADYARVSMPDDDWVVSGDDIYREEGNVGIGTSTPSGPLHVDGGAAASGSGANIILKAQDGTGQSIEGGDIILTAGDAPEFGSVGGDIILTPGSGWLPGMEGEVNVNAPWLKVSGNWIVGESGLNLWPSLPGNSYGVRLTDGGGDCYLDIRNSASWRVYDINNSQIRVTFTGSGDVGIGTPSPAEKLDVAGTAQMTGFKMPTSAASGYVLTSDANGVGTWQATGNISGSGTANYVPKFTASTTLGNSAVYETGGRVGIGATPDPDYKLYIYHDYNDYAMLVKDQGTGVYGRGTLTGVSGAGNMGVYGYSAWGNGDDYNDALGVKGVGSRWGVVGDGGTVAGRTGAGILGFGETGAYAGWFKGDVYVEGKAGIGTGGPKNKLDVEGAVAVGTNYSEMYTAPVNGMIIEGSVGIGTSSPGYKLDVAGSAHASSFPTSSDVRLKTNVSQLTNVLEKLGRIRGVSFEWNELYESLGRSTGHREIGVIAQEVEAVFPELITTWGDEEYRAVDYGRLTGVVIEAIKELKAENDALKQRIEVLEGR